MFGGFDGDFFDDLNVMSLQKSVSDTELPESTINRDYSSLVHSITDHDFSFRVEAEG